MELLTDYSGKLVRDLKLSDFSHDTLVALVKLYSKLYIGLDGFWYLTVKDRLGDKEALACDLQVWENLIKYSNARFRRQLKIRGNDVASVLKTIQVCPGFQNMRYKIEANGENNAILTVTYCSTLDALEQEGKGREDQICNIVEPRILKTHASFFNPAIAVKCLKSPPRKSKDDICC